MRDTDTDTDTDASWSYVTGEASRQETPGGLIDGMVHLGSMLAQVQDDLRDLVRELEDIEGDVEQAFADGTLDDELYHRLVEIIAKAQLLSD